MEKNTIAIIHFNPIERYPLLMNLLEYLGEKMPNLVVYVFTSDTGNKQDKYTSKKKNIRIERFVLNDQRFLLTRRYRNYFRLYYKTYQKLNDIRPEWIWYFETISALPVSWYFSRNKTIGSKLLIHYHEYMSPLEYQNGPLMVKWLHQKEKKLYEMVYAVSHTNEMRMQMFLRDNQLSLVGKTRILPNYPPRKWINQQQENHRPKIPLKIVYVGVVGMETLYIREFCQWVEWQGGKVVFDIYSQQDTKELQNWISHKGCRFTEIKGYVPYTELPGVLSVYDVGVILYKGHIPNYVFNAPNKLFEYWACGLDVWFPEKMTGGITYSQKKSYPKILPVNFEDLNQFDLVSAIDHVGLGYQPSPYYYEKLLEEFFAGMLVKENLN